MTKMKTSVSARAIALSVSICGFAQAQDDAPAGEFVEEESSDAAAAPAEEAPPASDEAPAADEAKTDDDADADEKGEGRFRFGVSGMGGPMMGEFAGGAGGVDLRFGWQLNNDYGIYAQPAFIVAVGASADNSSASATAAALAGAGALFEWTPINFVYLGGGLEVLTGGFGSAGVSTSGGSAKAASGPFFSIPLRAGLALGSFEPNRRKAFTIGLDAHIVITGSGPVILPLVALGYDAF